MGYRSQVVVALEHDAFYMANNFSLLKKHATILQQNAYSALYLIEDVKWYDTYAEINEIESFLYDFEDQVAFVRSGEEAGDTQYIGEGDGIDMMLDMEIGDAMFEPGVAVVLNSEAESAVMDSVTEEEWEHFYTGYQEELSGDSDSYFYFAHCDFERLKNIEKVILTQEEESYCIAKLGDEMERNGEYECEIYSNQYISYEGCTITDSHEDIDNAELLAILNAIETKWTPGIQLTDVNTPYSEAGRTFIMQAVRFSNMEAIDALMAAGADIEQENNYEINAVIEAFFVGNEEIINKVLTNVDLNKPLYRAFFERNIEFSEIYSKHGFDFNYQDELGNTLIMNKLIENEYGHQKIIDNLLEFGNHDLSLTNHDGLTAFDLARTEKLKSTIEQYRLKQEIDDHNENLSLSL